MCSSIRYLRVVHELPTLSSAECYITMHGDYESMEVEEIIAQKSCSLFLTKYHAMKMYSALN
jgi:hypothetical protein